MTAARASDVACAPAEWQRAACAFASAVESGRLDLPLPGSGATWRRWAAFADLAEEDLSLARLGEGHADAVAILAELGGPPPRPGSRWGVWAANPPGPNMTATRQDACSAGATAGEPGRTPTCTAPTSASAPPPTCGPAGSRTWPRGKTAPSSRHWTRSAAGSCAPARSPSSPRPARLRGLPRRAGRRGRRGPRLRALRGVTAFLVAPVLLYVSTAAGGGCGQRRRR